MTCPPGESRPPEESRSPEETRPGAQLPAAAPAAAGTSWSLAVRPTPFHRRTAEASRTNAWTTRLGWTLPDIYTGLETEHAALRNACTIADATALATYVLRGADAAPFLNRLAGGCGGDVAVGRSRRIVICDDAGALIADGLVLRPDAEEWLLTLPIPILDHLLASAAGFDVGIADVSDATACLAVEGPAACAALLSAGLAGLEALRPGGVRRMRLGLSTLTVARLTPTGGLGYELRGQVEDADWLWGRVLRAGEVFGMRPAGARARDLATLEAGHARLGVDYASALEAAPVARRSPLALGLSECLAWEGPYFTGRAALARERAAGAARALVGLTCDDPGAVRASAVMAGDRVAGHVASIAWSPALMRVIALADIDARQLGTSQEIALADGTGGRFAARTEARPFLRIARARMTPPAAC